MNRLAYISERVDSFRRSEWEAGAAGSMNPDPGLSPSTGYGGVERKIPMDELSPEREKQLEDWMEQIKAFIRNIDVSRL